ncbi:MAG TPA: alpha-hydroxy-acid oxidizing protein [Micromonosporaceae bacterium]|nr:alpha-hydroxy-acid oxidizing protein [Micromonosporaceae bacterium]
MASIADYHNEIYAAGLADVRPALPTDLTRLERLARRRLSDTAYGYVAGSAGTGATARANRAAFDRWRIVPRLLRDVSEPDLGVTVLGTAMPAPVILGPIGVLGIYHRDAELHVARAAGALGAPMILSTVSSTRMEDVATTGDGPKWFQLYWPRERDIAASLVERARSAGFTTLVVTLDTFRLAWRPRDLDHAFLPFLTGDGLTNYFTDPAFRRIVDSHNLAAESTDASRPRYAAAESTDASRQRHAAAIDYWARIFGDPTLTWADLAWLRQRWSGPIVLKGIQHPGDARRAIDAGMDGIVVSNHGGRQVDGAIGSLDALPSIVDAAGDDLAVLFDSGIRTGSDVAKALALGAKAVLIGRPYVYGLALDGEAGVRHVLRTLYTELELTLTLAGVSRPAELSADFLTRA